MQLGQLYCGFGSRYILYFEIESMAVSPEVLNEIQAALKQAKEGQLVQACHNLMAALTRHHLLRRLGVWLQVCTHQMTEAVHSCVFHITHASIDGSSAFL